MFLQVPTDASGRKGSTLTQRWRLSDRLQAAASGGTAAASAARRRHRLGDGRRRLLAVQLLGRGRARVRTRATPRTENTRLKSKLNFIFVEKCFIYETITD